MIELMIAMVLGLIVVAAVFNVYTGTTKSSRFSAGLQTIQENGRYGIGVLQRGFRLAGYSVGDPLVPLRIADGNATRVVVQTTDTRDCLGDSTAGATVAGVAINVYRFDALRKSITCGTKLDGSDGATLVENVEEFRVLYGLDADKNGSPERFVPWNVGIDPGQVAALRIGMLVSSGTPIRSRRRSDVYTVLDSDFTSPADRIARHVFQGTVELRNRESIPLP